MGRLLSCMRWMSYHKCSVLYSNVHSVLHAVQQRNAGDIKCVFNTAAWLLVVLFHRGWMLLLLSLRPQHQT